MRKTMIVPEISLDTIRVPLRFPSGNCALD
jgi:hypothetical protein